MKQYELFPSFAFDNRCDDLHKYLKANWDWNQVEVVYRLDRIQECSRMFRVSYEDILKEWDKFITFQNALRVGDE